MATIFGRIPNRLRAHEQQGQLDLQANEYFYRAIGRLERRICSAANTPRSSTCYAGAPIVGRSVYSPAFLIPYNIVLTCGFWVIYATRKKARYYRVRVLLYRMMLGGLAGELLHFLVAPRLLGP
jgi:hypothetical protein